jgi:hypothetical protein
VCEADLGNHCIGWLLATGTIAAIEMIGMVGTRLPFFSADNRERA